MARKGFFRRLIEIIRPTSTPSPRPRPAEPVTQTPSVSQPVLARQAIRHIVSLIPLANRDHVSDYVTYMDIEELIWTMNANVSQLKWRARQDADRLTVDDKPLNPWWYN